ncbi:hypothetical protein BGZ50_007642 [Haplosporangium sp. Z 11]|nr:hypothetical protein BGZ50_007642 [Haplosporangium sp. Z 11]
MGSCGSQELVDSKSEMQDQAITESAAPTDAQLNSMALDLALKTDLRLISAMVGKRLDIQNIDQELEQRLQDLAEMRAGTPNLTGHSESNGVDSSDKGPENEHSVDRRVEFTLKSVQLLTQLEQDLMALVRDRDANDPTNDKELLGLVDQRMIHTMLELIICWGIYPCLLPGVGMPLNRRIRSNIVQTELFTVGSGSSTADSPEDRVLLTNRLWTIIEPLARITVAYSASATMFTTLGSILANRHVPDLYAALLQLAYQPLSNPNGPPPAATKNTDLRPAPDAPPARMTKITPGSLLSKAAKSPVKDSTAGNMGVQQGLQSSEQIGPEKSRQLQQKEESAKLFHDLFWSTEAARSLESLTTLLSSSSPSHPTPVWLKSVSGRFLSQILLKHGGVRVVLEYMQGGNEAVKLDQLEKIARLVTSVPDQMSSVQEYYRTICPELLEILEMDLKLVDPTKGQEKQCVRDMRYKITPPSPQLVQTATFVVGKLLIKNPAICQVEIVAKEVEPLWKWGTRASHKGPEAVDTVPRQHGDVDDNVDDETGLDSLIASEYEVVKSVMFLHAFLVGNEPSPVLFQSFLAQAAQGLYRLYEFTTKIRSVLREKAKEILVVYLRILDAAETVEFLKTIIMRRRSPVSTTKPWQNLVSLNGRRIEELTEMGSVGECYFAPGPSGGAVLRRRSTQDRHAATQLELDVDVFMEFLGELETPGHEGEILGDLYMYLLDEYQAGKARGSNAVSPRRMLTMLQLILSMTQNLGPSIMSKVTQIIGLANNILEHQVSSEAKEQEDGEDDATDAAAEDTREADMEILGLVLTLLSAILNENEHLSQQDSHLLGLTLVHLKQLADHPLIDVRRVAHDLQTLIPTRLSNASTATDAPKKTEMEIEMEKYASALAALQDSLLPVRAHGLHILREMILAKSVVLTKPLVTDDGDGVGGEGAERELNHALDIFVQHVQEPDSFIYLNAVKGLAALTDAHGPEILQKLMRIYANENGRQTLDTRLRIGEALVQTVQRCGEALGGYLDALLPGLYKVMDTAIDKQVIEARKEERRIMQDKVKAKKASEALLSPEERQKKWRAESNQRMQDIGSGNQSGQLEEEDQDQIIDEVSLLRSSALTILATAAESCPTALLPEMRFLVDWVLSILDLDRQIEVRRAATLVLVLLFRALGGNSLYRIEGDQLKRVYRTLRYVEQVDEDALCRAQARAGIADLDGIVRMEMNPDGGSRPRRTPGDGVSLSGVGLTEIRYR